MAIDSAKTAKDAVNNWPPDEETEEEMFDGFTPREALQRLECFGYGVYVIPDGIAIAEPRADGFYLEAENLPEAYRETNDAGRFDLKGA